jgi:hypothetical protein
MNITYDESRRILTIDLQGRVFTVPGTHMRASAHVNRSTLNIGFLKDAEGTADGPGDRYFIKGVSRLDISL